MSLFDFIISAVRRLSAWRSKERTAEHPDEWTAVRPHEVSTYLTYASALKRGDHVVSDGQVRQVNDLAFPSREEVTAHFADGDEHTYRLIDRVQVTVP